MPEVACWFDGSITLNPGGRGTYGAIIKRDGLTVHAEHGLANEGPEASNNTAEYSGAIAVLKYLTSNSVEDATVYGDSQLVINQLNGEWAVKRSKLYFPFWQQAHILLRQIPSTKFVWIPREQNVLADALASPYFIK